MGDNEGVGEGVIDGSSSAHPATPMTKVSNSIESKAQFFISINSAILIIAHSVNSRTIGSNLLDIGAPLLNLSHELLWNGQLRASQLPLRAIFGFQVIVSLVVAIVGGVLPTSVASAACDVSLPQEPKRLKLISKTSDCLPGLVHKWFAVTEAHDIEVQTCQLLYGVNLLTYVHRE